MSNMSLVRSDPVSEALKKGKMPTLGEVKRSIKVRKTLRTGGISFTSIFGFQAMIKSLITTINQMENLPSVYHHFFIATSTTTILCRKSLRQFQAVLQRRRPR
jgi:hypothetical protein